MRRYARLRQEMKERGLHGTDIAEALGLSQPGFSVKLNGKVPWTLHECYVVIHMLGYDAPMLPILFPESELVNTGKGYD